MIEDAQALTLVGGGVVRMVDSSSITYKCAEHCRRLSLIRFVNNILFASIDCKIVCEDTHEL